MATATATATPATTQYKQLLKEAKEHEAFINRIKEEVSQEPDNLEHPADSLIQQLSTSEKAA